MGPRPPIFEVFLEPTCPFSVRAFGKLDDLLDEAGEERITIKVRLQSQPWHMYSGLIVRCILAASTSKAETMPRNPSWRRWPRIAIAVFDGAALFRVEAVQMSPAIDRLQLRVPFLFSTTAIALAR